MSLSDDLYKIDMHVEGVCKRLASLMHSVMEKEANETIESSLTAPGGVPCDTYLARFKWDEAKFPTKTPLRSLVSAIANTCGRIEESVKKKTLEWNSIVQEIATAARRKEGSLLVRDLDSSVVGGKENIVDTEYLATLLVVVSRSQAKEFEKEYETLVEMVVPRSAKWLAEDNDYVLYRVILFQRALDDFKLKARDKRWAIREFKVEVDESKAKTMQAKKEKAKRSLIRFTKGAFADTFVSWIHLKAIKIFVESVLRYCLPPNFQVVLLSPHNNAEKKLRSTLDDMYKHLTSAAVLADVAEEDGLSLTTTGVHATEWGLDQPKFGRRRSFINKVHYFLMRRAAFDVGSGAVKVSVMQFEHGTAPKILFSDSVDCLVGNDFKAHGYLSESILADSFEAVRSLQEKARAEGAVDQFAGIATAVFRLAKNGPEHIKRLREKLGVNLQVVSQEVEAQLGFDTGFQAYSQIVPNFDKQHLVTFDCGGSSFQITGMSSDSLLAFEGQWGSSSATEAMHSVQNRVYTSNSSVNPCSYEECLALRERIKQTLPAAPQWLKKKLSNEHTQLIAIGGRTCVFRCISLALNRNEFTMNDVVQVTKSLCMRSDEELSAFPQPEMLLAKFSLFTAICEKFQILKSVSARCCIFNIVVTNNSPSSVKYVFSNGNTLGVAAYEKLWAK